MNELRLQYHQETGHYPRKGYLHSLNEGEVDLKYVEWLEKELNEAIKEIILFNNKR